jgi:hypothetical protein
VNAKYWNKHKIMSPYSRAIKMGIQIKFIGFYDKNLAAYAKNIPVVFILRW